MHNANYNSHKRDLYSALTIDNYLAFVQQKDSSSVCPEMEEPLVCPLCLYFEPEVFGDYFVIAKCGHMFHNHCISKILERKIYQCPLSCKFLIEPENLQRVYGVNPDSRPNSRKPSSVDLYGSVFTNPKGIPDVDHTFKIALLGDPGVGKTSLIRRFSDNQFNENGTVTCGVDLVRKLVNIGGSVSQLIVWDTAGQETFRSIIPACVRGVHGILFVYDITNMDSFESISHWIEFADKNGPPNVVRILLGNKCDQETDRVVDKRCGKVMSDVMKMAFFETSAALSSNVEAVFRTVTAKILEDEWMLPSDTAWQQNSICLHDYNESALDVAVSGLRLKSKYGAPSSSRGFPGNDEFPNASRSRCQGGICSI